MSCKSFLAATGLAVASSVGAMSASGDVIYEELFTNPSGSDIENVGWHSLSTTGTTVYTETAWRTSNATTSVFVGGGGGGLTVLIYTEEAPFDPSSYTDLQIDFDTENDNAADSVRAALKIGGQWYATTNAQVPVGDAVSFDVDGESWSTLSVAGPGITLGGSAALPAGTIEGFGMLGDNYAGNLRYDNFTISGNPVPEPGTLVLGAPCLTALVLRRRRC